MYVGLCVWMCVVCVCRNVVCFLHVFVDVFVKCVLGMWYDLALLVVMCLCGCTCVRARKFICAYV